MIPDFVLPSDDCRLLLLLETTGSVRRAAHALRRDVSVVSRKISRIATSTPFLEKVDGQWRISEAGRRMNAWTQDAILSQSHALRERTQLRISTTQEFAARVLAPRLPCLLKTLAGDSLAPRLSLEVRDSGVEGLLLTGAADIGIDCGRPRDPLVRFERAVDEPFEVIASPKFLKTARPSSLTELTELPHLHFSRFPAATALRLSTEMPNVLATFNDLASIRSAACAGLGWALVPRYTIMQELERGELSPLRAPWLPAITPERFGVWWLGNREALQPWVRLMITWLREQKL